MDVATGSMERRGGESKEGCVAYLHFTSGRVGSEASLTAPVHFPSAAGQLRERQSRPLTADSMTALFGAPSRPGKRIVRPLCVNSTLTWMRRHPRHDTV